MYVCVRPSFIANPPCIGPLTFQKQRQLKQAWKHAGSILALLLAEDQPPIMFGDCKICFTDPLSSFPTGQKEKLMHEIHVQSSRASPEMHLNQELFTMFEVQPIIDRVIDSLTPSGPGHLSVRPFEKSHPTSPSPQKKG